MGPAVSVWGLMIVRNLTQAFFLFVTYRLSVGVYYFVYIYITSLRPELCAEENTRQFKHFWS